MCPLHEALKGKAPKHLVDWSSEREKASVDVKTDLAKTTMLAHPSPGVHEQWVDGAWQPLTFFSRQLRPPERKSTFDQELLAPGHPTFLFIAEGVTV